VRSSRRKRTGYPTGFTLVELLVVIAVIGLLAAVVGPSVFQHLGDAKVTAARNQIEIFGLALEAYRIDTSAYPSTDDGLAALNTRPHNPTLMGWRGPYLRKAVPADPWGRAYVYKSPGTVNPGSYDLYSMGRDGHPGGDGEDADVTSWGGAVKP
jgi:general secretion pathway protein G